jgi:hypothetical protein
MDTTVFFPILSYHQIWLVSLYHHFPLYALLLALKERTFQFCWRSIYVSLIPSECRSKSFRALLWDPSLNLFSPTSSTGTLVWKWRNFLPLNDVAYIDQNFSESCKLLNFGLSYQRCRYMLRFYSYGCFIAILIAYFPLISLRQKPGLRFSYSYIYTDMGCLVIEINSFQGT